MLIVTGAALGLLAAWAVSNIAESQRRPDILNESGPWSAMVPAPDGRLGVAHFDGASGALVTGCGEFDFAYTQDGTALTFADLPPAPKGCADRAAEAHTWFATELAQVRSFTPAEFWQVSYPPSITLLDAAGQPLLSLINDPAAS